jgi:hypothetical protein
MIYHGMVYDIYLIIYLIEIDSEIRGKNPQDHMTYEATRGSAWILPFGIDTKANKCLIFIC